MKSPTCLLLAALLTTLPGGMAAAAPHEHHGPQEMKRDGGKKWATDQALRQGMNAIRSAAAAILPLAHAGKASAGDYDAFAKQITAQVGHIVQDCKLEPKADAQLHLILGAMLAGAEMAQGKQPGTARSAGVIKVRQTLDKYGKFFDHPDWKRLAPPH